MTPQNTQEGSSEIKDGIVTFKFATPISSQTILAMMREDVALQAAYQRMLVDKPHTVSDALCEELKKALAREVEEERIARNAEIAARMNPAK